MSYNSFEEGVAHGLRLAAAACSGRAAGNKQIAEMKHAMRGERFVAEVERDAFLAMADYLHAQADEHARDAQEVAS